MKQLFFLHIVAILIVSVTFGGCNRQKKQSAVVASEETTDKVELFNSEEVKNDLVEITLNSPKPLEIANLINEAGASFISDLLLQDHDYEKMMTSTQKAFGIGVIGFDCKYSSVFNRPDEYIRSRSNLNQFIGDLGFQHVLERSKKFEDRIDQNKTNADSLKYLVSKIVDNFNGSMQNDENAEVYALVFMGANIQALYVVSQLTLMAQNNEMLLDILNRQHEHAKTVASLLEVMSGLENVKPYYGKMEPMVRFFAEEENITLADLQKIAPLIEEARNSMIQL